ncbi:MAG: hypothetical protein AB8B86_02135, partial [Pseudomonadales bacterium]
MYSLYRWRWSPTSPLLKTAASYNGIADAQNPLARATAQEEATQGQRGTAKPTTNAALNALSVLILSLALSSLADGAYIHAKANLAQWLIGNAWQKSHSENGQVSVAKNYGVTQQAVKPWPWADTWPVARLQYNKGQQDLYILAGAQGNSLAFGPGHL